MLFKLLTISITSSLPFLFTLHGEFVFDDSEAIVKNEDVLSAPWTNTFYNDFWGTNIQSNLSHKSYRPLTILSFRLNYMLNGNKLSAVYFKITNLICHVVCTVLVWLSLENIINTVDNKNTKRNTQTAYLAALLFAVHPIHVEAICGVVGRADILAANTFFLAFLSYNKCLKNTNFSFLYLIFTILFAAMSMLFKEHGVTVLGFCLIYELVVKFKMGYSDKSSKINNIKCVMRVIVIIVSTLLLLYGRWIIMGGSKPVFKPHDNPTAFSDSVFTKIATYNYIYFLNALLFVWPQWLCYDWSMGCVPLIQTVLDYRVLPMTLLYLYGILLLLALYQNKNWKSTKRLVILAVSLIVCPFLPASNVFYAVGFVIAERILYIPSAGYCLLLSVGFNKIMYFGKRKNHKMGVALYCFLLLIYSLRSWQRSLDWQNEYQLFVSGLSVCPLNAKVRYNVAKVADANRYTSWALAEYREAIRLYPEYYQAMNNLANLLKNQKEFIEAEYYLRAAVSYKRDFPAAWMNLGIILASTGRHEESHRAYKTALEYRNNYPDCLYNLGILYLEMNKTNDAMENWYRAVNLNATHALAWTNLLALLDNTGQLEKAMQIIPEALQVLPESPSINFAIANIFGKMDHYEKAEEHFLKAIKLFDHRVQALHYANLGVLYHRWKKYGLAEEMYKKALAVDPSFKSANKNLKSLQKLKFERRK